MAEWLSSDDVVKLDGADIMRRRPDLWRQEDGGVVAGLSESPVKDGGITSARAAMRLMRHLGVVTVLFILPHWSPI